jgi:uncharacterized protein
VAISGPLFGAALAAFAGHQERTMKKPIFLLGILSVVALGTPCYGQGISRRFDLQSKANGVTYTIEIVLPSGAAAKGSKYPVIYCTDWFILSDYLKALPKLMNMGRLTEPFAFVGISVQGNTDDWSMMRYRDFTPAHPTDEYSKQNTYAKALDITGGAKQFVTFLKDELIPHIESAYPVDASRRGFLGYSLGSLLGAYVLTKDPQLFQYYLIGSPSMWYNEYALAFEFKKTQAKGLESVSTSSQSAALARMKGKPKTGMLYRGGL